MRRAPQARGRGVPRVMLYRLLLGVDLLVAAAVGWFFVAGLGDGSVSALNIALWLAILVAVAAVIGGGLALHRRGRSGAAKLVLALLAVPAALFVLFFAVLILSNPRWN